MPTRNLKLDKDMKAIVCAVMIWSGTVFCVAHLGHKTVEHLPYSFTMADVFRGPIGWVTPLVRYDSLHYMRIAQKGYVDAYKGLKAFFPGFPLLMRYASAPLNYFVRDIATARIVTALFLNLIFLVSSLWMQKKLFEADGEGRRGLWAALFMLLSPYSFYYLAFYTEAFFLFLTIGSFYFARNRRWWLAALFAAAASGTRLQGIFVLPGLLVEYFHQKQWRWHEVRADILWLVLCPAGFVAYMYHISGIEEYIFAAKAWPQRVPNYNFLYPVWAYFRDLVTGKSVYVLETVSGLCILMCFFLLIAGWKKIRPGYKVYLVASMILPLLTSVIQAVGRYYTVLFPLFFVPALFMEKRPVWVWTAALVSGLVSGLLITCFTSGYWVA